MSECVKKIIKVIIIKNVIITVILIIDLSTSFNMHYQNLDNTRVFYNHREKRELMILNVHQIFK